MFNTINCTTQYRHADGTQWVGKFNCVAEQSCRVCAFWHAENTASTENMEYQHLMITQKNMPKPEEWLMKYKKCGYTIIRHATVIHRQYPKIHAVVGDHSSPATAAENEHSFCWNLEHVQHLKTNQRHGYWDSQILWTVHVQNVRHFCWQIIHAQYVQK